MGLTVLDAGVLIGFLDSADARHRAAEQALREAIDRNDRVGLPASAYAEVLVGPARRGVEAVAVVGELIRRVPIEIVALDDAIAEAAARLRGRHRSLKLPDALVIATASVLVADQVVTTDRTWPSRSTLGLRARISKL